jgi:hypothetical protein
MNSLLQRLVELEAEIDYKSPPASGQPDFCYLPGSIPVLISSPHGAAHTRVNREKEEDEYTSGLARLLAEQTGAHVLYAWRKSDTDPNFAPNTPYKQLLRKAVHDHKISFIIDLHGCSPDRSFGIGIGSMHGTSCPRHLPVILKVLAKNGYLSTGSGLFRLDLDRTFTGRGGNHQETITRFAAETLGVPALQIELNAHLRVVRRLPDATQTKPFYGNLDLIQRIISTLAAVILEISRFDKQSSLNKV